MIRLCSPNYCLKIIVSAFFSYTKTGSSEKFVPSLRLTTLHLRAAKDDCWCILALEQHSSVPAGHANWHGPERRF